MSIKYGIKILGHEEQYEDCIITRDSKQEILELADKFISATTNYKFSLIGELNRMQSEVGGLNISDDNVFKSKYTIPDYFINLLLEPYNLKLGIYNVGGNDDSKSND